MTAPSESPAVTGTPGWMREPDADARSIVNRTSMLKIRSVDQPRAVLWYRNVLGFTLDYDIELGKKTDRPFRQAVLVTPDGRRIEITGRGRPHGVPEDRWDVPIGLTFQVDDVDATRAHLQAMAVTEFEPELDGQYGPLFTVLDPDNNLINLQFPNEKARARHGLEQPAAV